VYAAIDACLPRDTGDDKEIVNIEHKKRIDISSITCKKYEDLGEWFSGLSEQEKTHMSPNEKETPPEGEGYVFTLIGYHYYNDPKFAPGNYGIDFVVNELLKNLQSFEVKPEEDWHAVPVGKLGISHPTILLRRRTERIYDPEGHKMALARSAASKFGATGAMGGFGGNPTSEGYAGDGGSGFSPTPGALATPFRSPTAGGFNPGGTPPYSSSSVPGLTPGMTPVPGEEEETGDKVRQLDFVLQFVWKPTPMSERPETDPALATDAETEQPTE
jgi:type IV pilus assembly protein PilM